MRKLEEYNHIIEEKKWQDNWLNNKIYKWDETLSREENFVIDTPPPTVSGLLHMGHIFSYTQADFIARFQRMNGKNVFYPMGFDDNGLPTERLVEKVKNIRAVTMPRAEFIENCKEVVSAAEDEFRNLFRTIGLSVDWDQEYQTISSRSTKMSQLSFLDLLNKGLIYRQLQPTLWDTIDQTALSQADIEDKETPGLMNYINFTAENESIVIATTRPELLPACKAVFYHPEDKRYQHLVGKLATTPLFNISVPIIADTEVDMEKGSGLVMCCTFGDVADINWWKKYKFTATLIINKVGRLDNLSHLETKYSELLNGLKVKEARTKVIELLQQEGLIIKQENITQNVKCAERSGAPLEILINHQWFINVLDHKETLLNKAAECNWNPAYMKVRVDNWINGLNWDWCISRQRFFGVPFPVWYSKRPGEEGKIILPRLEDLPVDPIKDAPSEYSREEVEPDMDVMDTWATSSISPQLNSLAINKNHAIDYERHQKLFPADLRPQAHEIIRTWAFYTIVKSAYHEQTIPWKNLMISGWCLAADKTKMSKSKGNVVTPLSLIEEKGADIVRYWASNSRLGADIAYSEDLFKIGKKLVNKLWNASKFAAIHLEKLTEQPLSCQELIKQGNIYYPIDLWIISKLHYTIKQATLEFERFEYSLARDVIEKFFWQDFCDNYLELVKVRAYNENNRDKKGQLSAIYTIYHCLEAILKLFAPFLPFITEDIYSKLFAYNKISIHKKGNWPQLEDYYYDPVSDFYGEKLAVAILDHIRKEKANRNISLKTPITKFIIYTNENLWSFLEQIRGDLMNVTNVLDINRTNKDSAENVAINDELKVQIIW